MPRPWEIRSINSGYEVQVYDSYGVQKDAYPGIECGGIYPQWIHEQNVDGHSPRVNASKPPGEWQAFDILSSIGTAWRDWRCLGSKSTASS